MGLRFASSAITICFIFVVTNRCFSSSITAKQFKAGCCFNAIEIYSGRKEKCDALGTKTLRGLLYDIGMSFV